MACRRLVSLPKVACPELTVVTLAGKRIPLHERQDHQSMDRQAPMRIVPNTGTDRVVDIASVDELRARSVGS